MVNMHLKEMNAYVHTHIPITSHMGVQISAFQIAHSISLSAPLAANINHRNTAFGGSLSTLGILAGWALIHFSLQAIKQPSRIVIQSSQMDFLEPGESDMQVHCSLDDPTTWARFCNMLTRRGRARITLPSQIHGKHQLIATHQGVYVAMLNSHLD